MHLVKEQVSGHLQIIDAKLQGNYYFLNVFLEKCTQMISQCFLEYFWTYTLKIVLTYTPTPTARRASSFKKSLY